jgi:cytidine deaminase
MSDIDWSVLLGAARAARRNAHAPYSGYSVGAALLTRSGRIFAGCNVENAAYGLTICAERSAIAQMISAGEREPIALQVVTAGPPIGSPCGMCRQTLAEFAADLPIHLGLADADAPSIDTTLGELLPLAFRGSVLSEVRR